MYHAVNASPWKFNVTPREFEKQMLYIQQHYVVVPLMQIVEYAKRERSFTKPTVAITFDDGYADTFTEVFPLMQKLQLPFTVFLTTSLESSTVFGNIPRLSWEQIITMHQSGLVSFEVHGHAHINLKTIVHDEQAMRKEIVDSQQLIATHTGRMPTMIAYASGHKNDAVLSYVDMHGFIGGFTINEGLIQPGDMPLTLKRTQIDGTMNFIQFTLRLTGGIDIHRKIVHTIRYGYIHS
jgi:peptidoglycan/xylan/chitin deacetylase (PgdA/CDA1 family)